MGRVMVYLFLVCTINHRIACDNQIITNTPISRSSVDNEMYSYNGNCADHGNPTFSKDKSYRLNICFNGNSVLMGYCRRGEWIGLQHVSINVSLVCGSGNFTLKMDNNGPSRINCIVMVNSTDMNEYILIPSYFKKDEQECDLSSSFIPTTDDYQGNQSYTVTYLHTSRNDTTRNSYLWIAIVITVVVFILITMAVFLRFVVGKRSNTTLYFEIETNGHATIPTASGVDGDQGIAHRGSDLSLLTEASYVPGDHLHLRDRRWQLPAVSSLRRIRSSFRNNLSRKENWVPLRLNIPKVDKQHDELIGPTKQKVTRSGTLPSQPTILHMQSSNQLRPAHTLPGKIVGKPFKYRKRKKTEIFHSLSSLLRPGSYTSRRTPSETVSLEDGTYNRTDSEQTNQRVRMSFEYAGTMSRSNFQGMVMFYNSLGDEQSGAVLVDDVRLSPNVHAYRTGMNRVKVTSLLRSHCSLNP